MRLSRCVRLHRRNLHGTWFRALHPKYLGNPLGTSHTRTHSTRYSPGTSIDPAFEILYLAEDQTTTLFEVQALLGSPYPGAVFVANPAGGAWTLVDVHVNLQAVVDFTRLTSRQLIKTTIQELTGDWRGYSLRNPNRIRGGLHGSDVPTQALGRRLAAVPGIEGFISYSAKAATRKTLMVFPQKLLPGSQLQCRDPASGALIVVPEKIRDDDSRSL